MKSVGEGDGAGDSVGLVSMVGLSLGRLDGDGDGAGESVGASFPVGWLELGEVDGEGEGAGDSVGPDPVGVVLALRVGERDGAIDFVGGSVLRAEGLGDGTGDSVGESVGVPVGRLVDGV